MPSGGRWSAPSPPYRCSSLCASPPVSRRRRPRRRSNDRRRPARTVSSLTMADIVMADDGITFDGKLAETAPMGGAEAAFVGLAQALARRGHRVTVANNCAAPIDHNGVAWQRLDGFASDRADLYIANRGDRLLRRVRAARRTIFWLHNPADYLLKWRYLSKLALRQPLI